MKKLTKLLLIAAMLLLFLLPVLLPSTKIQEQLDSAPLVSNLRLLDEDEDDEQNDSSGQDQNQSKKKSQLHFYLVIAVLAVLMVGGCILCIVCFVRKLMNGRLTRGSGGKIANIAINYDFILPSVRYRLFRSEIGVPLQDSCIICLDQFEHATPKQDKIFIQAPPHGVSGGKFHKSVHSSLSKNCTDNIMVKYTVCGHLLHEKCLNDWLSRQQNCPLCRESFKQQNLQAWEQKFGISFDEIYDRIVFGKKQKMPIRKSSNKNESAHRPSQSLANNHQHSTLSEFGRSAERNQVIGEQGSELSQKVQMSEDINPKEIYAIHIYKIIMNYHLKKSKQKIVSHRERKLEEALDPIYENQMVFPEYEIEEVANQINNETMDRALCSAKKKSGTSLRPFEQLNQLEIEVQRSRTAPLYKKKMEDKGESQSNLNYNQDQLDFD